MYSNWQMFKDNGRSLFDLCYICEKKKQLSHDFSGYVLLSTSLSFFHKSDIYSLFLYFHIMSSNLFI